MGIILFKYYCYYWTPQYKSQKVRTHQSTLADSTTAQHNKFVLSHYSWYVDRKLGKNLSFDCKSEESL